MSKGNLNKFFEELNSNSDLNEQFKNFLTNLSNLSNDEKGKKLTEFITKQGYTIDKSHFKHEDSTGFSDDELANVAGGGLLNAFGHAAAESYCGAAAAEVANILI